MELAQVSLFADGVAVRRIGAETFLVASLRVDEVILVGGLDQKSAQGRPAHMGLLAQNHVLQGIGDVRTELRRHSRYRRARRGLGRGRDEAHVARTGCRGEHLVAIESGANMTFDRLRHVVERAELGERREALLAVAISERPGSFLAFYRAIGEQQITEFNYSFADPDQAKVPVGGGVGSRRRGACLVDRPTPTPGIGGCWT